MRLRERESNMKQVKKEFYHKKSLVLAKMFTDLYAKHGGKNKMVVEIRERYITARQQIDRDEDGSRYGSKEAYQAMRTSK